MDRPKIRRWGRSEHARNTVDAVYRSESRQVLATLIRLLGDFDIAEEALHDAFAVAVEQWSRDSVPANPRAWLISPGPLQGDRWHAAATRFDASLDYARRQATSRGTSDAGGMGRRE